MAKKKRKKKGKDPEAEAAYQELLDGISKIIEDARARGVDLFERAEILTCTSCGAYEDVSVDGRWYVCNADEEVMKGEDRFLVVDIKEWHRRLKSGMTRHRTTYMFICTVCGSYQNEVFIDEFDI